jgi:3-oxoacyl-[acyl-carrier-protein] synthase-1
MSVRKKNWGRRDEPVPIIAATAAINGLGFDSHQTWAFWRAGVTPLTASPFRLENGERATMVPVRTLEPTSFGVTRLSAMTVAVLEQLEPALSAMPAATDLTVILCVAERFEQLEDPYFGPQRQRLEEDLQAWFAARERSPKIQLVARGHAGHAHALLQGCAAVMERATDAAVIGGVDSYFDPLVVDILMEQERIFDQVRVDSFIPGEGAALALVTRRGSIRQWGLPALAFVETVATAEEPAHMLSDAPCLGLGLSRVMRCCTDRLRDDRRRLEWLLGDLTNESYRSQEFQLAFPRAIAPGGLDTGGQSYQEVAADELQGSFLPAVFGDLGAATMPTALVLATEAFVRGRPCADSCLIIGSSVTPDRGAVLLSRATTDGREKSSEEPCR